MTSSTANYNAHAHNDTGTGTPPPHHQADVDARAEEQHHVSPPHLPLPLHPSYSSNRRLDVGVGVGPYRSRSSSYDHKDDEKGVPGGGGGGSCSGGCPGSISTSPTSSKDSDFETTLLSLPIPPPPPPPMPPLSASTTSRGRVRNGGRNGDVDADGGATPESMSSVSVSATVSEQGSVPEPVPVSPSQGSSTCTKDTASNTTSTTIEHEHEHGHGIGLGIGIGQDDYHTPGMETEAETETINLLNLASITLASTIIASKIIQKHSKLFSEEEIEAESSSCGVNCCQNEPIHLQRDDNNYDNDNNSTLPKSRVKTNGTIVTDADGESQRIITSYIKSISPTVRIVGEESMDEIQKSHVSYERQMHSSKHTPWWGASPGSKRKLIKKEEKDEDYICEFVKMEVYLRYNMYKEGLQQQGMRGRFGDDHEDDQGHGDDGNDNDVDSDDDQDEINVDPSRVSIFVDPLDGTSAYAKGNYEAVTILAGIILDNVPIFGIIVKPFGHEGINVNFHKEIMTNVTTDTNSMDILGGSISGGGDDDIGNCSKDIASNAQSSLLGFHCPCSALYGGTLLGGAFVVSGSELDRSRVHRTMTAVTSIPIPQSPFSTPTEFPNDVSKSNRKAIISKSRGGGVVRQCINSLSSKGLLDPEPIYITGAGYKTLRLLLGTHHETMWFFPKPGTSLWDVAAADALLRCMGGRISDKFGKDLDYSKSWTDADNLDGIIACSDRNLHAKCLELYREEGWDDE